MKYVHRFCIQAPLEDVAAFHRHSSSMAKITPPPVIVQMHEAPHWLQEGDEIAFTLWVFFVPVRWHARIENVSRTGFWDRQLHGPFAGWRHKHFFVPLGPTTTEVLDEIEAQPGRGWWGKVISMAMWLNLPLLFAYRAWRTRRLLHAQMDIHGEAGVHGKTELGD